MENEKELKQFIADTGKALASHAESLARLKLMDQPHVKLKRQPDRHRRKARAVAAAAI
jgi:hypothetical protein